jgi:hypothetical protein
VNWYILYKHEQHMELIRNVLYPVDSSIKCLKKEYNNA